MRSKMNITHQLLVSLLVILLVTGCIATQRQDDGASSNVLDTLTQQQTMTLLAMLESYDSHQDAIEAWQSSRTSLVRLVELESDLKLLITQLNSLNQAVEQNPKQNPKQSSYQTTGVPSDGIKTSVEHAATQDLAKPVSKVAVNSRLAVGFTIQLTALISLDDVHTYWRNVKRKHTTMFAKAAPFYEQVTAADGTELFRLKVGVFDTETEAVALCRDFTQAGGTCFTTKNVKGESLD